MRAAGVRGLVSMDNVAPVPSLVSTGDAALVPSLVSTGDAALVPSLDFMDSEVPVLSLASTGDAALVPSLDFMDSEVPVLSLVSTGDAALVPGLDFMDSEVPVPGQASTGNEVREPCRVSTRDAAPALTTALEAGGGTAHPPAVSPDGNRNPALVSRCRLVLFGQRVGLGGFEPQPEPGARRPGSGFLFSLKCPSLPLAHRQARENQTGRDRVE